MPVTPQRGRPGAFSLSVSASPRTRPTPPAHAAPAAARALAYLVGDVGVGLGVNQRLHHLRPAELHRPMQRRASRQAPVPIVLLTRIRSVPLSMRLRTRAARPLASAAACPRIPLPKPPAAPRARQSISLAAIDPRPAAAPCRPSRARCCSRCCPLQPAPPGAFCQRAHRLARSHRVRQVGLGAGLEQRRHHVGLVELHGAVQRGLFVLQERRPRARHAHRAPRPLLLPRPLLPRAQGRPEQAGHAAERPPGRLLSVCVREPSHATHTACPCRSGGGGARTGVPRWRRWGRPWRQSAPAPSPSGRAPPPDAAPCIPTGSCTDRTLDQNT